MYLPPASASLLSESRIDRLEEAWDSPLEYARVVGMKNVKSLAQLCVRTGGKLLLPFALRLCVCVCVTVRKEYTFARVTVETNHTDTGVSMHNL